MITDKKPLFFQPARWLKNFWAEYWLAAAQYNQNILTGVLLHVVF